LGVDRRQRRVDRGLDHSAVVDVLTVRFTIRNATRRTIPPEPITDQVQGWV
jgi:hypothetical protein